MDKAPRFQVVNPGPLLNYKDVHKFEFNLSITLPPILRRFIFKYNGGEFEYPVIFPGIDRGITSLYPLLPYGDGSINIQDEYLEMHDEGYPRFLLPIGEFLGFRICCIIEGEHRDKIYLLMANGDHIEYYDIFEPILNGHSTDFTRLASYLNEQCVLSENADQFELEIIRSQVKNRKTAFWDFRRWL